MSLCPRVRPRPFTSPPEGPCMADVTLFRQSAAHWPGGSGVHVLEQRQRFMLVSLCHKLLAAILAETATVDGDRLARLDRAALLNRGSCRHCVDAVG
jgi:hypothetical protein